MHEVQPITPLRRPKSPHRDSSLKKENEPPKKPSPQQFNRVDQDKPAFNRDNRTNFRPNYNKNKVENRREDQANGEPKWGARERPAPRPKLQEQRFPKSETKCSVQGRLQEWANVPEETKPAKLPQPAKLPAEPKAKPAKLPEKEPQMAKLPMANLPAFKSSKVASKTEETPLVPAKCLIDMLEVGKTAILSVECPSEMCRESRPGFICLSLHGDFQESYQNVCEDYQARCETSTDYTPSLGESFSLFVTGDAAWYRARLVAAQLAALLDSGKVVSTENAKFRPLMDEYREIPEFCCLLTAQGVKAEAQLKATIKSRSQDGICVVSLVDLVTDAACGEGQLARWRPRIDAPPPAKPAEAKPAEAKPAEAKPAEAKPAEAKPVASNNDQQTTELPSVPRPQLTHNQSVVIVHSNGSTVVVREASDAAQYAHDMAEQGVALYGKTGNEEVTTLSKLYPCPEEFSLANAPAVSSFLKLAGVETLTPNAEEYLTARHDMTATVVLPEETKSAPSGSEATLILSKSNKNLNKELIELSTPDWKKVEESNKTVLDTEVLYINSVEYLSLPPSGQLRILDASFLSLGNLSVCAADGAALGTAARVEGALGEMITEYCNSELGREPYLPRNEELCIAQCPPYDQWFRAMRIPDPDLAPNMITVLYLDYGNMAAVSHEQVRKMMPEFVKGEPALASTLEINGLPEKLSTEALAKAREFLQLEGAAGAIEVANCKLTEPGTYTADCPTLIAALQGLI